MEGTFTLTIKLGNDAMQTAEDIGEALGEAGRRMVETGVHAGGIRDENGNTVGCYDVRHDHGYTLQEIRNGTGWARDTRFAPIG